MIDTIQCGLVEQVDVSGINRDMNKEMMIQFLASVIVGVMEWWIINSMPYSATDIVEQLWSLLERIQVMPHLSD